AALITLGVWAFSDYLTAKSARTAEASLFDSAAPAPEQSAASGRSVALPPPPAPEVADATGGAPDPHARPAFQSQRKPRRPGAPCGRCSEPQGNPGAEVRDPGPRPAAARAAATRTPLAVRLRGRGARRQVPEGGARRLGLRDLAGQVLPGRWLPGRHPRSVP